MFRCGDRFDQSSKSVPKKAFLPPARGRNTRGVWTFLRFRFAPPIYLEVCCNFHVECDPEIWLGQIPERGLVRSRETLKFWWAPTISLSGTADRLRCCQFSWKVSVVNWRRSRWPVYHTDRKVYFKERNGGLRTSFTFVNSEVTGPKFTKFIHNVARSSGWTFIKIRMTTFHSVSECQGYE